MNNENRQKTLAAFNDLWQGNPIRRTRAGDGHSTLYGRRLAVHLMVQPSVASIFMADPLAADTSFLPRFLMCEPQSTIGSRLQANTKRADVELEAFSSRMRQILAIEMPMDAQTNALEPRVLELSADARGLVTALSDAVEQAQGAGGSLAHITGTASKVAEQACRIAGVLTLWRDINSVEVQMTKIGE